MKNNLIKRILEIKKTYDKYKQQVYDIKPEKHMLSLIAVCNKGQLYLCRSLGATHVDIYSKTGEFIGKIKDLYNNTQHISITKICFTEDNDLIISDFINKQLYKFNLKTATIEKTVSFAKSEKVQKLQSYCLNPKFHVGDVVIISIVALANNKIAVLTKKFCKENKKDVFSIIELNEDLGCVKTVCEFECSKILASRSFDLHYDRENNQYYLLKGGINISKIENKQLVTVFDSSEQKLIMTSFCMKDNYFFITVGKPSAKLLKISVNGELIYSMSMENVNNPSCIRSFNNSMFIVSRGNNKIIELNKAEENV